MDDVESEEEIFAESVLFDLGSQISIGGGDDAHRNGFFVWGADALDFLFLQSSQQFDLHTGRQLADFVEEERALRGGLEKARFVAIGAREGAFGVAKKLALDE